MREWWIMSPEPRHRHPALEPRHGERTERHYEQLVASINGIVWEADPRTIQFTFVSRQAERLLGYSLADWYAPDFWVDHLHPDDREWAVRFCRTATLLKQEHDFEYRMIAADGRIVWLRDIVSVIEEGGEATRLRGVMVDATEQKRAQAALRENGALFRLLTEHANDFIQLHDLAGLTVYASPSTERLYGRTPTRFLEFAHPDDAESGRQWWERVVAGGEELLYWRIRDTDGAWRWLETRAAIVPYQGEPHVLTICRDVTERWRAEEERRAHLWFLEGLDRVNRAIQGTNDIEQMMRDVLDAVNAILDADQAGLLYPCDPEADSWVITMFRARPGAADSFAEKPIVPRTPDAVSMLRALRESEGPVRFGPGCERPLPDVSRQRGTKSLLAMAIHPKVDQPYFFGVGQASHARVWTPAEERLFEEIGRRLADALTVLLTIGHLRESEARLDEAQRIAHVGHWELDLDADRLTWSDETYRILGLRPGERTPTLHDFVERIHPEDRERQADATARAKRGEGRYDIEYRIVRPDGEVRTIHAVGDVIRDAPGRAHRAFGVVQDITERKGAEDELRKQKEVLHKVFDNAPIAIHFVGEDGRVLLVNPEWERIFGWTLRELREQDRDVYAELLPDAEEQRKRREFVAAATGEWVDFRVRRRDGRLLVVAAAMVRLSDGTRIGLSYDVTELKRLEEQFRQAQKMEAVGQLAGGVAHDFNNLLTVITAHGAMLREELAPDAASRADIEQVLAAAQRAAGLTRQLLAFSRQQVLQPRVVATNRTVATVAAMLRRVIGEDVVLVTELDPAAWPVYADPGQLEQVLMNLAVNGRDAMPLGGTLRLRTANVRVDDAAAHERPGLVPGEYAALMVEDTGTGIDPAVLPRLFEPFFTTKAAGRGTGLGLATVYGIVKQSGGFIYVDSTPGRGSRFTIYLPRHQGVDDAAAASASPAPPRGTETILLVEDDAAVRPVVRRMLERQGYTVLDAANGAAALRLAESAHASGERIDLVLTDVVMPELGGRALGERLAVHQPGIRVLYMSGYTDDEILRRGLLVPGAEFLEKPFTPERLAGAVRQALDR
jgi:PAS domain S-box-containing protein